MAGYKPYEAPQHMQDYAEKALDPFGNSMLGQNLNDKEVRLKEQIEANEEQAYWNNFINQGGSQQGEEIPNPDVMMDEDSGIGDILGNLAIYGGTRAAGTKLIQKGLLNKLAAKGITRGAGYFVPGAGQLMLGADALDFLLPEGYSPYEGFGLAPDNALSNLMSMGNISNFTGGEE